MVSIVKQLTIRRFTFLLFVFVFAILLAVNRVNFHAVDNILFRFREILTTVVTFSVSLIIFPFISVPAVESIVERAEKLNIKANPRLVKDYVDGCYIASLLSTVEIVLIITIQLVEGVPLITLAAFALLLTLVGIFFVVIYSLWIVTRILQEIEISKS